MLYTIRKTSFLFFKIFLILFLLSCFEISAYAKSATAEPDSMVHKFYQLNQKPLYWFSSSKNMKRAAEWLTAIELATNLGFVSDKVQINQLQSKLFNKNEANNALNDSTDKQITGVVLNFLKYLQEGNVKFDYDEVRVPREHVYINQLRYSRYKESVSKIVSNLDCKDAEYKVLKKYLNDSITVNDTLKYKTVLLAMNYRRYFTVNHQTEYILVNIPEAEAKYYRNDLLALKMRTVVGKKKNATPTISSYITNIVTFPNWNVPHTIAVKELLPKVKKDDNYLEQNNFDVVDAKGNLLDEAELNWAEYDDKNFPYYFRQSTGAGNALGVIKFNLQNPFSIFLHATSSPEAFKKEKRFLSHGCIRLEKPLELANALLRGNLEEKDLKVGKKDSESNTIRLPFKIPTFIIYLPLTIEGNKVTFIPDVYGLIK